MARPQNTSRYRLWIASVNHGLLNRRQEQELLHFLGYGPGGCDSHNYRIAQNFNKSIRTIQYDLRHLEKHHLIETAPGWAELKDGKMVRQLRGRRITTLPWPSKTSWMSGSIQKNLEKVGAKNCTLQRRTHKMRIRTAQQSQIRAVLDKSTLPSKNDSAERD